MNRYAGWSYPQSARPPLSPYASVSTETMPINEEDIAYITSEDLEHQPAYAAMLGQRFQDRPRGRSASPPVPEDDVLIVKNKGVTYPAHFAAYSIFDGKVRVRDVQDRVGEMMDLSPRATRDVKLLYKGINLKSTEAPVRDYGVKNNSEILAVIRDLSRIDMDDTSIVSSTSGEDVIMAPDGDFYDERDRRKKPHKSRRRRSPSRRRPRESPRNSPRSSVINQSPSIVSPRGSTPNLNYATVSMPNLSVPGIDQDGEAFWPSVVPGGPMEKLEAIAASFENELIPMCNEFIAETPTDLKRLEDEHRKLTETIMQKILLKLDEVEIDGQEAARARRKELVTHTQQVLRYLDDARRIIVNRGV